MNRLHHWLCRSPRWREMLRERVPWVLANADLGADVLELGPGPGLTTDLLRLSATRLTALELDGRLSDALRTRFSGSNVEVVRGDATAMPFPDAHFTAGVSFTMLHHVPSAELQDRLLREVFRVLVPGGVFVGSDSRQSWFKRVIHIADTLVPVDPDRFGMRLEAAGFEELAIEKKKDEFRFHARRPARGEKNSLFAACAEIAGRGDSEGFAEHGGEGAGRRVSGVEGSVADLGAFGQEAQGVHEAELLTPVAEGCAGFLLKQALYGSPAGTASFTDLLERLPVAWIAGEHLCDAHSSGVGQVRKLQGDHLDGFKLVDDGVDQVELGADVFL